METLAANYVLPRLEPFIVAEATNGIDYLAQTPVLAQSSEIRAIYEDMNLLELIHTATNEERLRHRILELPKGKITNWLIGGKRDTLQMQKVWQALQDDEMAMVAIKGGDVPILTDYLLGKRKDLPERTELDFCLYVLGGTEEHLRDFWRTAGLLDVDIDQTRTNRHLCVGKIYNDGVLIGEAQDPHRNFAWNKLIDDVYLSPISFLSARILAINCRGETRFFLFDPLGGINDWYGKVRSIAKPTDFNLLNDPEVWGTSWFGNGFPYALYAITYANAEISNETIHFLANAYAKSKNAAILWGDWNVVEKGIKSHITKLFAKLTSLDQEIRFISLMELIYEIADDILEEGSPV